MTGFFRALAALIVAIVVVSLPAAARNVPGSSAEVQDKVDLKVASDMTDVAVQAATSGPLFYFCDSGVRRNSDASAKDLRNESCNWGLNVRGEFIHLSDDENGFDYDTSVGIASALVSYQMNQQTKVVMGLLVEKGSTDTDYNFGDVNFMGYGGTIGIVHELNRSFSLSLLGSAEWLNYDVSRSNGLYTGEYDALRLAFDAAASGTVGDDDLWATYRAGLRYIKQNNDDYVEFTGGSPFANVSGSDIESLLVVSNLRIGSTMDGFTPFVEGSSNFAVLDNSSNSSNGSNWFGRLGVGFTADVSSGTLEVRSGVRLTKNGYVGYDVAVGYSLPF